MKAKCLLTAIEKKKQAVAKPKAKDTIAKPIGFKFQFQKTRPRTNAKYSVNNPKDKNFKQKPKSFLQSSVQKWWRSSSRSTKTMCFGSY